ncbi:MAG: hypothetical protein IJ744_08000 [Lachnospiraceae bacterium]|nr:hypothetical protein [Lachnospiraceae bacterium]
MTNDVAAARDERAAALAGQVLGEVRARLTLSFPYLSSAFRYLKCVDSKTLLVAGEGDRPIAFGTDSYRLYYDPWYVLSVYREDERVLTRDYLHVLLHCLFRHFQADERKKLSVNRPYWDLSCDIAVEALIGELAPSILRTKREAEQETMIQLLKNELGKPLTAERIYTYLKDKEIPAEEVISEREHFAADQHKLWYYDANGQMLLLPEEETDWRQVEKETQILAEELEDEDALLGAIAKHQAKRLSYEDLLRAFFHQPEILHPAEEFDYIYYTYGMQLYENIPLIEPLEYQENEKIRTFVIAIDTSGSVQGDALHSFVMQTVRLLSEDIIADQVRIHLLQCDDQIREEVVVNDRQEMEAYLAGFQVKGKGQTDFRPVFAHVGALQKRGELPQFQGLIYYTDGQGRFPEEAPEYPTLVILSQNAGVPAWAESYVMTEEDWVRSHG